MTSQTLAPTAGGSQRRATIEPGLETCDASPPAKAPRGLGRLSTPWPDRYKPWRGRATPADRLLMGAFTAMLLFGFATKPLKPFLLAEHPVALAILSGDLVAIGAAAAFASIGETSIWLVVAAGGIGMVKFDWLMWWAGRVWGEGMLRMVTTGERAQRFAARAKELRPWILGLAVAAAVLPGIPTPIVYAMAGMAGMRLATFLVLDLLGALAMAGLVAGLGYELGQHAVDMVLLIDRYAGIISMSILGTMFLVPWVRRRLRRGARLTA